MEKIVLWNQKKGILTVVNDKQPISNDYNSAIVREQSLPEMLRLILKILISLGWERYFILCRSTN